MFKILNNKAIGLKNMVILLSILILFQNCKKNSNSTTNKIFSSLDSNASGINFSNSLTENDSLNFFTYGYIYMGGGVAAGDVNDDGLVDLYFTGNMVQNSLYINKGNLKFEEISTIAGVEGNENWMTGVTMVDVNNDGKLDIYICVSGLFGNKKNILYINQGNDEKGIPNFKEQAEKYGIADAGQSIQSVFFDYDLDGDLDLYVANYPITSFKHPPFYYANEMRFIQLENSDHLYRNNGDNTFTDVTIEAGLLSHGLSLSATVGDLNNDGFPDIYISNDFASPDYMYFNNGDGTFSERSQELTKHTAYYGMGVDIADFNNDGLLDIAQMDMTPEDNRRSKANMGGMNPESFKQTLDAGLHYQYMKNTLQLNNGINIEGYPVYSDIAYLAGVATTDWSWSSLFVDLDNDGYKDLYVTNGSRRDINNKDYFKSILVEDNYFNKEKKETNQLKWVEEMPSERIDNYMFKNNGDLTFTEVNKDWGISFEGFSNGAVYADLDNDGDLEIIVNNIDDKASIFQNHSSDNNKNNFLQIVLNGEKQNPMGLGTKVQLFQGNQIQYQELTLTRGFQSSVDPKIHFGLGTTKTIDSIKIKWPDGKQQTLKRVAVNQHLKINYKNATNQPLKNKKNPQIFVDITSKTGIEFKHQENRYNDYRYEVLLPHETSKLGPGLATADVNGDGLDDFYIGGAHGFSGALYIQQKNGTFQSKSMELWYKDKENEDTAATFFDANGDGFNDLYIVSGGNEFTKDQTLLQDRLYMNDGKGNFTKIKNALPVMPTSGGCVAAGDFDGDGDLDLFVGGRLVPGKYPEPARSYLLENISDKENKIQFKEVTEKLAPDLLQPGLVTSAVWVDIDQDEQIDLIISGEWMPVMYFKNQEGQLINKTAESGLQNKTGWWFSLTPGDFDGDGDIDLIAGNLGLNYKYQATPENSFDIYLDDFDLNGHKDIVLSYYYDGIQFPVRGKSCSSQQIPAIKNKFEGYNEFAIASVADVYSKPALDNALHYQVTTFASSYIENLGDGKFKITPLPNEAQISSINGAIIDDFNNDGNLDVFVVGNFYISEIETPRNDAGIGLILFGKGDGTFYSLPASERGALASYDTRAASFVNTNNGKVILLANNNEKLRAIKIIPKP
ncbi:MAG: VCBS repeat-containing protein [Flavobacteriaceae bacterium]|nr:VCBS repeat-containing protein [Flavobacteriaceae bacterium]